MYEKVRDQSEFLGDQERQLLALSNLGIIAREEGDLATAHSLFEQALNQDRRGDRKHP